MQPLPQLPSPTLTNPDLVLPHEMTKTPATVRSPLPYVRIERPPSPTYLKDHASDSSHKRSGSGGSSFMQVKKEKRGLMSRKMMLARSRTASSGYGVTAVQDRPKDHDSAYASSPTMAPASNYAPAESVSRWSSNDGSSTGSDSGSTLPQLLANYESSNASVTDDELDGNGALARYGYAESNFTGNLEAERRQKEEEEQNSAILSRRAEEILANAKKRLNLMEGNLRGARDLVAPLTAANLKRATSIASYVPSQSQLSQTDRYIRNGYQYATPGQPQRTLHPQASSPTIGRDFQGHLRGFSEGEVTERSHNALDGKVSPIVAQGYIPTKANDPFWTRTLKGSRSHDSLGNAAFRSRDGLYSKGSPDPNLAPLLEDEDPTYGEHQRPASSQADSRDSRASASTPDDLHEQMNSLKGRISALKERAREDSLRRQSMQNMRDPSPLNNATSNAPELMFPASSAKTSSAPDKNAALLEVSRPNNPDRQTSYETLWESDQVITGSRNAFAEQAQRMVQQQGDIDSKIAPGGQWNRQKRDPRPSVTHKRTPSGTAIIQSSKHRYSHHQLYQVRDMQGVYGADEPPAQHNKASIDITRDESSRWGDDEDSQAGASAYEEAQSQPHQPVLAHEDREDAFDYESFFLHSAMLAHGDSARRSSTSSEESVDSVSTARGPAFAAENFDEDDQFETRHSYPPGTPQTPEKLRQIEKSLNSRALSNESLSTMVSFATATEGRDTPEVNNPRSPTITPRSPSVQTSRPSTISPAKQPEPANPASGETSSERADSGVSLNGTRDATKRPSTGSLAHKSSLSSSAMMNSNLSPPLSPTSSASQDPASVIVKALLAPDGRQLGLRDKALLFGLVDGLKKVCAGLQENSDTSRDSRDLRKRLDDARRVLAGGTEVRPGTS